MQRALYVLLGVLLVPAVGLVGDIVTDGKFKSTMSTGAPLEVSSDDMVANLNADMVDGVQGTNLYTKAEVDALVAAVTEACAPRQYYLTNATYDADEVYTACANEFHFANLYEIVDVSNLRYARYHPDAYFRNDSGMGPPTSSFGWVRTGFDINSSDVSGFSNCDLWTSTSPTDFGSEVSLHGDWETSLGIGWRANSENCAFANRVWCIED